MVGATSSEVCLVSVRPASDEVIFCSHTVGCDLHPANANSERLAVCRVIFCSHTVGCDLHPANANSERIVSGSTEELSPKLCRQPLANFP